MLEKLLLFWIGMSVITAFLCLGDLLMRIPILDRIAQKIIDSCTMGSDEDEDEEEDWE